MTRDGEFFTSTYSDQNHYEDNILIIEKFRPEKIWSLAFFDPVLGFHYLKRFAFISSTRPQRFVGSTPEASISLLTDTPFARMQVIFGGSDAVRPAFDIDAEEFIAVKSFKARGKRISNYNVKNIVELEPLSHSEPEQADPSPDKPYTPDTVTPESFVHKEIQPDLFDLDDAD